MRIEEKLAEVEMMATKLQTRYDNAFAELKEMKDSILENSRQSFWSGYSKGVITALVVFVVYEVIIWLL